MRPGRVLITLLRFKSVSRVLQVNEHILADAFIEEIAVEAFRMIQHHTKMVDAFLSQL